MREECGIFIGHSLHDAYKGMGAIQHRGQETAGISAKHDGGIDTLRWSDLVSDFSLPDVHKILKGYMFAGHVRYSTTGDKSLYAAHPRILGGNLTSEYESHIINRNAQLICVHNGTIPGIPNDSYDWLQSDTDLLLRIYKVFGPEKIIEMVPASYSAAIMDKNEEEAIIFRDRHEIKPLWIGEKDGKIVAASEDVAIWDIGGTPIREVKGGEIIYINNNDRKFRRKQVVNPVPKRCFFEFNYNSKPSSTLEGKSVSHVRYRIGVKMAEKYRPDVDIVTYIPHAPEQMARGYSDVTGIPFQEVFYKIRAVRAYMQPDGEKRKFAIKKNLYVLDNADVRGKRVLVIDDSIVRLNNAPDAVKKLREKGPAWVGLALGTPPIGGYNSGGESIGCLYGNDMPPQDEAKILKEEDKFAALRFKSHEELVRASGFDDIFYISPEDLLEAQGARADERCLRCIGGDDPISEDEKETFRKFLEETKSALMHV